MTLLVIHVQFNEGVSMILMIDNYDSFTYNLVQYLGELGQEIEVRRNDEVTSSPGDKSSFLDLRVLMQQ